MRAQRACYGAAQRMRGAQMLRRLSCVRLLLIERDDYHCRCLYAPRRRRLNDDNENQLMINTIHITLFRCAERLMRGAFCLLLTIARGARARVCRHPSRRLRLRADGVIFIASITR